jgi:hypothetical protein
MLLSLSCIPTSVPTYLGKVEDRTKRLLIYEITMIHAVTSQSRGWISRFSNSVLASTNVLGLLCVLEGLFLVRPSRKILVRYRLTARCFRASACEARVTSTNYYEPQPAFKSPELT